MDKEQFIKKLEECTSAVDFYGYKEQLLDYLKEKKEEKAVEKKVK